MGNALTNETNSDARVAADILCDKLRALLGPRLISFLLHGSAVLGDLAAGYSDLDFLAVIGDELSEADCLGLREMRVPFCAGEHGLWGSALEGSFLPRAMLDPAVGGRAFWWGTSGERNWNRNDLGWFTLWVIREKGLLTWGENVRGLISPPPSDGLTAQAAEFCKAPGSMASREA